MLPEARKMSFSAVNESFRGMGRSLPKEEEDITPKATHESQFINPLRDKVLSLKNVPFDLI